MHKNKSFRGIGSYGDILIPGPLNSPLDDNLVGIVTVARRQVERVVVAHKFDLRSNELKTTLVPEPSAGPEHVFKAYRPKGDPPEPVTLRERSRELGEQGQQPLLGRDNDGDDGNE